MKKEYDDQLLKIQATLFVILENQAFLMGAIDLTEEHINSGKEIKDNFNNRLNKKIKELKVKNKVNAK